jgi:glycine/D-amino acid oxidase-like deaminating enzyme
VPRARAPARPLDVKSGYPFWAIRDGLPRGFPRLAGDRRCDVVVMGAGITGALIAHELATHGHDVVVLDACDVAWGSTAASTALLQYEIDAHLEDLAGTVGLDNAVLAYRACAEAIPALGELARATAGARFARSDSLYLASRPRDRARLRRECALRVRHGLPARWLEPGAVRERYGLQAPGAIHTPLAARADPYRFAIGLLERIVRRGAGVFDHAPVRGFEAGARGVAVHTDDGTVRARQLVIAAGYGSQQWLRERVARNHSTYALVTDPLDRESLGVWRRTLLWESARPYLYLRATADDRLMIGGLDDGVDRPARRDARVGPKAARLLARVGRLLPALDLRPSFAWAGTFAETADGLPFFGPHPQHGPRVHFAMAYGGNGITYAMIGAGLLRARIERRAHPLARLFSFARL